MSAGRTAIARRYCHRGWSLDGSGAGQSRHHQGHRCLSGPPSEPVRRAAEQVASEFGLPDDWLNDGIKEFFYKTPPQRLWHTFGNLCVYAVSADYMLALKIYAARVSDRADVQALIHHLDLHSAEEIQEIVERYIPTNLLGAKHRFFAESCIEEEGMSSP